MRKFITRISGLCDAELKHKQEIVANSAYSGGWLDMALYVYNSSSESYESRYARYDGIIAGLSKGDVVVVQLPTGNGHMWEQEFISHIKAYGGIVVTYLHYTEYSFNGFNDSIKDTVFTCDYQPLVIADTLQIENELIENSVQQRKILVREEANEWFDIDYYALKILNLACEAVLLEGGCRYQMIRKDVERSTDNAFSYCAARAAYGGRTAISYKYSGAADIIVIKSGNSVIWQTENIREHYALVDAKESYTICAMVYTPTGKVTVAATEAFGLSEPVYCEEVPKISLIIPMFNSSEFIAGTIDSVIGQSQEDIELVLVDDESTDNTTEIVKWYCHRFKNVKLLTKENGGQGSARNAGLDYAHGRYITFMDHDDILPPDAQKILYELVSSSNADIGIGNVYNMVSRDSGYVCHYSRQKREIVDADSYMDSNSPVMIWNKIYKADLCRKIKFVPRYHEDISWSPIVFSFAKTIALTSEIVYEWNRIGSSQSLDYNQHSEEWFTETYCVAVRDALERCNRDKLPLVKKMILTCEAFNYHPGLYESVKEELERAFVYER